MRVLLAGGGTAGHIEPALNLAAELSRRDPETALTFLGTARGLETRLVPAHGYELTLIDAAPLPRRVSRGLMAAPFQLRRASTQARQAIVDQRIEVVVGFGSYVALPAYLAARGRCVIVVHEANAKPGLANRIGARLTKYVAQAVDGSLPHAVTLGIPLRSEITELNRPERRSAARAEFGLDPRRRCLLVFGGSQGARRINAAVVAAVPSLLRSGWQILHAYGAKNSDQVGPLLEANPFGYHAVPYIDRMPLAYAAADLAICRSGAMTCAELAAVGLPAIYVPLPIGNGEQRLNADPVIRAGGGVILADADLSADRVSQEVAALVADPSRLNLDPPIGLFREGLLVRRWQGRRRVHAGGMCEEDNAASVDSSAAELGSIGGSRLNRMSAAAANYGVRDGAVRLANMVEAAVAWQSLTANSGSGGAA